jgi:hypothetical protein
MNSYRNEWIRTSVIISSQSTAQIVEIVVLAIVKVIVRIVVIVLFLDIIVRLLVLGDGIGLLIGGLFLFAVLD